MSMMELRMLLALSVSPEERASARLFRSSSKELESETDEVVVSVVVALDAALETDVVEDVLAAEAEFLPPT